jgi:hypothetical protein
MIANPHAAAVVKRALDAAPDSPHSGVTAIDALEESNYRVITIDEIKHVVEAIAKWKAEAERKMTLRAEIEAELGLTNVEPDRYMDAALDAIRGWKRTAEAA